MQLPNRRKDERTYHDSFFTSLKVSADNVAEIAWARCARWKIENENFNCMARYGHDLKHNFGHGQDGLVNLLATLNLFAFTLHEVLNCVADLWRQGRNKAGTSRRFFEKLLVLAETVWLRDWTELLAILQGQRRLVAVPT